LAVAALVVLAYIPLMVQVVVLGQVAQLLLNGKRIKNEKSTY
jgi:hypothetical protein